MPATNQTCTQCGRTYEMKQRQRKDSRGNFCEPKCKTKFYDEYERKTGWLLIQIVKKLVNGKRLPRFKARSYPGVAQYRKEWNRFAEWVREVCH